MNLYTKIKKNLFENLRKKYKQNIYSNQKKTKKTQNDDGKS